MYGLLASVAVLAQLASSHPPAAATPGLLAMPPNPHAAGAAAAPASSAGGVSWTAPKAWEPGPGSSWRVVTYKVAAAAGDSEGAEVAVFYFGEGKGGGTQANIERWLGQFQPEKGAPPAPKPTTSKVNGMNVTVVTTEGTYASGMPGGAMTPKSGWALRGAVVEAPEGSVFFKMVGPKKTVARATAEFDALLRTLRK